MGFPKLLYIAVAGAVVFNSTLGVIEIAHPIHEVYPSQNITRILAAGTTATSGGTIFISGDKAIT